MCMCGGDEINVCVYVIETIYSSVAFSAPSLMHITEVLQILALLIYNYLSQFEQELLLE